MNKIKSSSHIYLKKAKKKNKINPLNEIFPKLPADKFDVIYADPPWDYGGSMQFDKTSIKRYNKGFKKDVFISAANFVYPTVKLEYLKKLDVESISNSNSLLFMWTTGPQFENSIELGVAWGFEYKTVAFVWDKMIHNPGAYTMSQTEFCLVFKKGKIPQPRGARNIKQFFQQKRGEHSVKPIKVIEDISIMFPTQKKIELFARNSYEGWERWGLEIPESKHIINTYEEINENKFEQLGFNDISKKSKE